MLQLSRSRGVFAPSSTISTISRGLTSWLWSTTSPNLTTTPATQPAAAARPFSATTALHKKKRRGVKPKTEDTAKIAALKANLFSPPPPPLRMARNRYLRHWTIHRAWLLRERKVREARLRELTRMRQGMYEACEELRRTAGPGKRPEGYLYRVAMEKKGVYGPSGIPVEYARLQTDTPAKVAWNHEWTM